MPSWMHEDAAEINQIAKPGGATLKLKDSTTIMTMKNSERSKGTFQLFSGQFAGQSNTAATHSADALGPARSPPARPQKRDANPPLLKSKLPDLIGRPVARPAPNTAHAPWYQAKGSRGFGSTGMSRSWSSPGMEQEYTIPSWMHEDHHEVSGIDKPGGATLKMKDSTTIMSMKNKAKSKGTFQLFSGKFAGETVTSTTHSAEALRHA